MAAIITAIGQVFTEGMTMAGDVLTLVGNSPLLLLSCIIGFVGLGVGLAKRLLR